MESSKAGITCYLCSATSDSGWKFCIECGSPLLKKKPNPKQKENLIYASGKQPYPYYPSRRSTCLKDFENQLTHTQKLYAMPKIEKGRRMIAQQNRKGYPGSPSSSRRSGPGLRNLDKSIQSQKLKHRKPKSSAMAGRKAKLPQRQTPTNAQPVAQTSGSRQANATAREQSLSNQRASTFREGQAALLNSTPGSTPMSMVGRPFSPEMSGRPISPEGLEKLEEYEQMLNGGDTFDGSAFGTGSFRSTGSLRHTGGAKGNRPSTREGRVSSPITLPSRPKTSGGLPGLLLTTGREVGPSASIRRAYTASSATRPRRRQQSSRQQQRPQTVMGFEGSHRLMMSASWNDFSTYEGSAIYDSALPDIYSAESETRHSIFEDASKLADAQSRNEKQERLLVLLEAQNALSRELAYNRIQEQLRASSPSQTVRSVSPGYPGPGISTLGMLRPQTADVPATPIKSATALLPPRYSGPSQSKTISGDSLPSNGQDMSASCWFWGKDKDKKEEEQSHGLLGNGNGLLRPSTAPPSFGAFWGSTKMATLYQHDGSIEEGNPGSEDEDLDIEISNLTSSIPNEKNAHGMSSGRPPSPETAQQTARSVKSARRRKKKRLKLLPGDLESYKLSLKRMEARHEIIAPPEEKEEEMSTIERMAALKVRLALVVACAQQAVARAAQVMAKADEEAGNGENPIQEIQEDNLMDVCREKMGKDLKEAERTLVETLDLETKLVAEIDVHTEKILTEGEQDSDFFGSDTDSEFDEAQMVNDRRRVSVAVRLRRKQLDRDVRRLKQKRAAFVIQKWMRENVEKLYKPARPKEPEMKFIWKKPCSDIQRCVRGHFARKEARIRRREVLAAVLLQSVTRRYLARKQVLSNLVGVYEKIYDPSSKAFYYYNKMTDTSHWEKPALLRNHDLEDLEGSNNPLQNIDNMLNASAHTVQRETKKFDDFDQPAVCIQNLFRHLIARKRMLCAAEEVYQKLFDEDSQYYYYFNSRNGETQWEKPVFLGHLDIKESQ